MEQFVSEQDLVGMAESLRLLHDSPDMADRLSRQQKFIMRVTAIRIDRFLASMDDDDKRAMECAIDDLAETLLGIDPGAEVLPVFSLSSGSQATSSVLIWRKLRGK